MRAGQKLIKQRQYAAVRQLLKCVGESGTATRNDCDALILSCVSVAEKIPADVSDGSILKIVEQQRRRIITPMFSVLVLIQAKELESLILETKSTESKVVPFDYL